MVHVISIAEAQVVSLLRGMCVVVRVVGNNRYHNNEDSHMQMVGLGLE
jgi:hypothetical protein